MTHRDKHDTSRADRWNRRYSRARQQPPGHPHAQTSTPTHAEPSQPAAVLQDNARYLPAQGTALDLACGLGANALWLAERGLSVRAWDISAVAVEGLCERARGLDLQAEVRDVVQQPPEPEQFDVIVVTRFLDRALCPALQAALRVGGTLFYQTFTHGLSNPDYLLAENELLHLFPALTVLWYHEPDPVVGDDGRARAEAGLVARRSA